MRLKKWICYIMDTNFCGMEAIEPLNATRLNQNIVHLGASYFFRPTKETLFYGNI